MLVKVCLLATLLVASNLIELEAGIIKDVFQKITGTNNKTEETVKESAPICGSGTFSTPDEKSLSPEIIFITDQPSRASAQSAQSGQENDRKLQARRRNSVNEVAREFRFHEDNVTLAELERNGFNRDAPVSILMHGFTSGYPLQAWISAIVEAYTIDRESLTPHHDLRESRYNREGQRSREPIGEGASRGVRHNLFIINWNYAARGNLYPRAVANIPIVASYVTRFVNNILLDEAGVDPRRVQLIGHSLGAHLAGFIGKNTRSKLGRIYGLDPAGPCFGSISGPLYPASKRLAATDAEQVITLHTNTALLGIDKPIGRYSVYVEGGSVQPGCKGGKVLSSIQTLTWDGGDFDTVACSHSRAPNLLTYRHDQSDGEDDCQLVAYECKDWDSFNAGHCGLCRGSQQVGSGLSRGGPSLPVECLRVGLDWQYPRSGPSRPSSYQTSRRPNQPDDETPTRRPGGSQHPSSSSERDDYQTGTRRPYAQQSTSGYGSQLDYQSHTRRPYGNNSQGNHEIHGERGGSSTRQPQWSSGYGSDWDDWRSDEHSRRDREQTPSRRPIKEHDRRAANETQERRASGQSTGESKTLFLRTSDTQPYCAYQYQVILELREAFRDGKPPMSILLQDSESDRDRRRGQNSLSSDEFGNKFDDKTYTHLLTSGKKLARIDHATLLFRNGLPEGPQILNSLQVNYMSHIDPEVRRKLSSKLCLVRKNPGRGDNFSTDKRFYFEPCAEGQGSAGEFGGDQQRDRRPD